MYTYIYIYKPRHYRSLNKGQKNLLLLHREEGGAWRAERKRGWTMDTHAIEYVPTHTQVFCSY